MINKNYELKNLNCAHCAGVIDSVIGKIENVESHSLNFVTKELKLQIKEENANVTIELIKTTIKSIESVVEIVEKRVKEVKFRLENLFCQSCSSKIEEEILKHPKVNSGFYNFSTQILNLHVNEPINVRELHSDIKKIVDSIEEGVTVISLTEIIESEEKKENNNELIRNIIGTIIFVVLLSLDNRLKLQFPFFLVAYLLIGSDIVIRAFKNLKNKNAFDENFLMTIATLGAFGIKEYPEAVAVMLFYKVGEFFQSKAVTKSRKSIEALVKIKPNFANVLINGVLSKVSPESVNVGDRIIVNPGENIPLDGVVIKGSSSLDTKALTGESMPQEVTINDNVLSGSININSTLEIKATKDYLNSTVTKILDLVENASIKKSKTENFITTFSKIYTPVVVGLAVFVGLILPIFLGDFNVWFYRALIFLVISCPCALVVSIPLGYFGGIGRASRNGILIKGSNYLDALTKVKNIVVDKTGTLTKGTFVIEKLEVFNGFSEEELIKFVSIGENGSNHPIALAIKNKYNKSIDFEKIQSFEILQGYGTKTLYDNSIILTGNEKLMKKFGIESLENTEKNTIVHIAKDSKYVGYIILADEIKSEAKAFITELTKRGLNLTMLSGDNKNACEELASKLQIKNFYSSLLPADKVEEIEKLIDANNGLTIFVGDGINDAPVLKRADIGISMGGIGSDAAIEASDIVIMDDKLNKILKAIDIANKTRTIVIQNIVFALGVKLLIIILGLSGHANMWEAIFADVGVALIAIFNSIRALRD